MSVAAMSDTLKKHIVASITKTIQGSAYNISNKQITASIDKGGKLNLDTVRSETDRRAESIFSRGGLESLKRDMLEYHHVIERAELSKEIIASLSYEDFVSFVIKTYYGVDNPDELSKSTLRKDPNFKASGRYKASGSRKNTTVEVLEATNREDAYKDVLIFKNIDYDRVVEYFTEYMLTKVSGSDTKELRKYIKGNLLNAGHLAGAFNARFLRTFGAKRDKTTGKVVTNIGGSNELASLLDTTLNLLVSADYLSSNILNDPDLFITSEKQLSKTTGKITVVTEVQLAFLNQKAGDLLKQAGRALNSLIKVTSPDFTVKDREVTKRTREFYEKLQEVKAYVDARAKELSKAPGLTPRAQEEIQKAITSASTFEALLSSQGSPSLEQHILSLISSKITGTQINTSVSKATVKSVGKKKSVNKNLVKPLNIKKTKLIIDTRTTTKPIPRETLNLSNLQNLLNQNLAETIRQNMGDGTSATSLNYRTGRFAESVKVERLSESRHGMVTAFYSYMKNPYATFSVGGRQAYPSSRDPKLLIAKSIREIAGTTISNRMRSVNV